MNPASSMPLYRLLLQRLLVPLSMNSAPSPLRAAPLRPSSGDCLLGHPRASVQVDEVLPGEFGGHLLQSGVHHRAALPEVEGV